MLSSYSYNAGVGKVRPAGSIDPARGGSSVLTLNLDERLFSRPAEFGHTLIVDAD